MRRAALCEGGFCAGHVFRRIDTDGTMTGANDMNSGTVFEGAELLESFDTLERSWFPLDEPGEKIATISVDADVPERRRGRRTRFIAWKGDATP